MPLYRNEAGTWTRYRRLYRKVAGVWTEVQKLYRRAAGIWQRVFLTTWADMDLYQAVALQSAVTYSWADSPSSMTWSADGTIVIVSANGTPSLRRIAMTTPWDFSTTVSTTVYDYSASFANLTADFSDDGAVMWLGDSFNADRIEEYTLSTPWDPGTATATGNTHNPSRVDAFRVVNSGTQLLVTSSATNTPLEFFAMSVANDISTVAATASSSYEFFPVIDDSISGVHLYNAGQSLVITTPDDAAWFFTLPVAYSFSTPPVLETTLNLLGVIDNPAGADAVAVAVVDSGAKMATAAGRSGDSQVDVRTYALGTPYVAKNAREGDASQSPVATGLRTSGVSISGDGAYVFDCASGNVRRWPLSTPFAASTLAAAPDQDVNFSANTIHGAHLSKNGDYLYLFDGGGSGFGNESIVQYTLSTPGDLTTATLAGSYTGVTSYQRWVDCPWVDDTGEYFYVVGRGDILYPFGESNRIHQFRMSVPHDISTMTFNAVVETTEVPQLSTIAVSPDGKTFVLGTRAHMVAVYTAPTSHDLAAATYLAEYSLIDAGMSISEAAFPFFSRGLQNLYWEENDVLHQRTAW